MSKTYPDKEIERDWIVYYQVISWEWRCPLCGYENKTKTSPGLRDIVTCLKCNKHFENIRQGS